MVELEGFFKAESLIGQLVTVENLTKNRCWVLRPLVEERCITF